MSLTSAGQPLSKGSVQTLDVYEEHGTLKIMQRIVPDSILPDQVDVELYGEDIWGEQSEPQKYSLNAGLDLSDVALPRSISDQHLGFATSQGEQVLDIRRFTTSELGCIMIAIPSTREETAAHETSDIASKDGPVPEANQNTLMPEEVIISDNEGNVLTPFTATNNGMNHTSDNAHIIEFAGISPAATSVTLTPLTCRDFDSMTREEHMTFNDQSKRIVDLINPGVDIPTSEYGGYTLTERTVADHTITFRLKPYGWAGSYIELTPLDDVTMLASTWTDPSTGEIGTGYHVGIEWQRRDPLTGELLIMDSYYAASDEEPPKPDRILLSCFI